MKHFFIFLILAAMACGKSHHPTEKDGFVIKLINGENFNNVHGKMAILEYPVYFENPGKYFVWVNAYSTSKGLHTASFSMREYGFRFDRSRWYNIM